MSEDQPVERWLDVFHSDPDRSAISNSPLLEKSVEQLKKSIPSEQCTTSSEAITANSLFAYDNDGIKQNLLEFKRFFYVFYIGNQYFNFPLLMPDLRECVNETTYYLAISIAQWKRPDREICTRLFTRNDILTNLFNEIQEIVNRCLQLTSRIAWPLPMVLRRLVTTMLGLAKPMQILASVKTSSMTFRST